MKRTFASLLAIILAFSALAIVPVAAKTSGDWQYWVVGQDEAFSDYDPDTTWLTLYTGTATDVVIPEIIDGYTISAIDSYAFWGNEVMESVTIPAGVKSIHMEAFQKCTSLKTVYFCGSQEQWERMKQFGIDSGNEPLLEANIIFNSGDSGSIPGDLNGDGKLNARDVTALMKAIIDGSAANIPAADFNGDGKVNARDVTALMKAIIAGK